MILRIPYWKKFEIPTLVKKFIETYTTWKSPENEIQEI